MHVAVRGTNLIVPETLRAYVERKLHTLGKYLGTAQEREVQVTMSVQKDGYKVRVNVPLGSANLQAEEKSDNMYTSVDLVEEKLERQIRKWKTKVQRKHRDDVLHRQESLLDVPDEEESLEIVRIKKFQFKPMDAEEAVMQMNLLGHDFYAFRDSTTGEFSVVYRRKDDKFGLIVPE